VANNKFELSDLPQSPKRTLRQISETFLWVAVIASLLVAALGSADSVSSFVRNRPIPGVFEITELSLVVIIFMAQPYLMLTNSHIKLDLYNPKSGSFGYYLRAGMTIASGLLCYGLIAWTGFDALVASWEINERTDGVVLIPIYPVKFFLVLGAGVTFVSIGVILIYRIKSIVMRGKLERQDD